MDDAGQARRAVIHLRRWLLILAIGPLVLACTPSAAVRKPPPLQRSSDALWAYGAYLLAIGDVGGGRAYIESVAGASLESTANRPQLLRDLAEARLFSGDSPAAAEAARSARQWLARQPRTAQFQDVDRRFSERILDSLAAAGDDDIGRLETIASDETSSLLADTWYLLGWVRERHGDSSAAQIAYRAFLARDPQWTFLRTAETMRRHAQELAQ